MRDARGAERRDARSAERAVLREYLAIFNERRLDDLETLLAERFVSHLRVGDLVGRPRFRALIEEVLLAFPDIQWIEDESIYSENRAVLRYHWEAVQREAFLGIPPTHKMARAEGVEILHIEQGVVVEVWNYVDIMGLAAQLRHADPLAIDL